MTSEAELAELIAKLRDTAEELGLPAERLLIAASGPAVAGEPTVYEMHVGAAEDFDTASMLDYMARELTARAEFQSRAVYDSSTRCPNCQSVRYGRTNKVVDMRAHWWHECLACGHTDGDLPPA